MIVELPDKRQVEFPDDTPRETVEAAIRQFLGAPSLAGTMGEGGLPQRPDPNTPTGPAGTMIEGTIPTDAQRTAFQLVGGLMAGTGVAANAAVGGALAALDPAADLRERLYNAAWGAGIAGAISGAVKLAGFILGPKDPKAVELLDSIGVKLSPAQRGGVMAQKIEQGLESVPLGGQQVSNVREAARESFVRAATDMPLKVIGQRLSPDTPAGHAAVKEMAQKVSAFYDDLLPKLNVTLDAQLADDVATAHGTIAHASKEIKDKFRSIIQGDLTRRFDPATGVMTGQEMKAAEEVLGKEIKAYSVGGPDERKLADALDDVLLGLRNLVMRSNPADAPDLARANIAYAMSKRVQNAAATAVEGKFTPRQLWTATTRRSQVASSTAAKGEGLMQDVATAAEKVMGSKLPDSGTAMRQLIARTAVGAGLGGGAFAADQTNAIDNPYLKAALGVGGIAALYSPAGRAAIRNAGHLGRLGAPIGASTSGFGGQLLMGGQQ